MSDERAAPTAKATTVGDGRAASAAVKAAVVKAAAVKATAVKATRRGPHGDHCPPLRPSRVTSGNVVALLAILNP